MRMVLTKGARSTKYGRDSKAKSLGVKCFQLHQVQAGLHTKKEQLNEKEMYSKGVRG